MILFVHRIISYVSERILLIMHLRETYFITIYIYSTTTIDEKVKDRNLGYYINRKVAKYVYYLLKLMKMNILLVKKYYLLIKTDLKNKLDLLIHHLKSI